MISLAEAAVRYAAHGWHVFPLAARGKEPQAGHGYLDATADVETVRRWWRAAPTANIGLWPGRSGLVIIDIDGPDGAASAMMMGLLSVETATVTTGRPEGGRHIYFRHPGGAIGNRALAPSLDVRGDRGYVVVPPSVHPTGAVYTWGSSRTIAELPTPACALLRAMQREPRDAAPAVPPPAPSTTDLGVRIDAYLGTVGHASEGARNATAYRVAAWLTHDMALGQETAWSYLAAWNAGNAPPLGARELRVCLASAVRHGEEAIGSGLERERPSASAHYGRRYGASRYGASGYGDH